MVSGGGFISTIFFDARFNALIPDMHQPRNPLRQRNLMQQIQNSCVQLIESDVGKSNE